MKPESFPIEIHLLVSAQARLIFEQYKLPVFCVHVAKTESFNSGTITHEDTFVFGDLGFDTTPLKTLCHSCAQKHRAESLRDIGVCCAIYNCHSIAVAAPGVKQDVLTHFAGMIGHMILAHQNS